VRSIRVEKMAHAWSGGPQGATYSDSKGPDATRMILDFFDEVKR
jgi:poly(3-hydroxybutyrate) depolymerase